MQSASYHRVRDYKKGDEEVIAALFRAVFGKELSIEQWNWKYAVRGNGNIYSKVVEDEVGTVIGHAGAIPLQGVIENRPVQFFQIADVMVHPKARGFLGKKNVFDALIKILFEDLKRGFPDLFCYGFPGVRPFSLGKRVGVYDEIEQAVDCTRNVRRSLFTTYRIKKMSWDDARLDDLWVKRSDDFTLSLVRDGAYLRWRYGTSPFFSYQLLGCFHFRRLTGWAVIRDTGEEVLIIDLLAGKARYRHLLRALENSLASAGKETMRLWLPANLRKGLIGYAEDKTQVIVTNMIWKLPVRTSFAKERLFYTMGDADIF